MDYPADGPLRSFFGQRLPLSINYSYVSLLMFQQSRVPTECKLPVSKYRSCRHETHLISPPGHARRLYEKCNSVLRMCLSEYRLHFSTARKCHWVMLDVTNISPPLKRSKAYRVSHVYTFRSNLVRRSARTCLHGEITRLNERNVRWNSETTESEVRSRLPKFNWSYQDLRNSRLSC